MAPQKEEREEQRYVIKHYCALNKTAYQIREILKATYSENALGRSTVYRWHEAFVKEGRKSAKLRGGPGTPMTKLTETMINTAAVIVKEDK